MNRRYFLGMLAAIWANEGVKINGSAATLRKEAGTIRILGESRPSCGFCAGKSARWSGQLEVEGWLLVAVTHRPSRPPGEPANKGRVAGGLSLLIDG